MNISIWCMTSYVITEQRIYTMIDSDYIVFEKCNFVHEKSLKVLEFHFWKSVGTMPHHDHNFFILRCLLCYHSEISHLLPVFIPKICSARTIGYNSKKINISWFPLNWKFHHKPLLVKNCRTSKFLCVSIQLIITRSQGVWYKNCFTIEKPEKFIRHI